MAASSAGPYGQSFLLADRSSETDLRVGPYHVTLDGLESTGIDALTPHPDTQLIVLDEVGKMESFSPAFREKVEELIAGPTPLLATVAVHGVGFVKKVRYDRRITLVRMKRRARAGMLGDVLRRLAAAGIAPEREERKGPPPAKGPQSDPSRP